MYKNREELREMTIEEIAKYCIEAEQKIYNCNKYTADDEVPYIEWCGDELDDILTEKLGEEYYYQWNEILQVE